MSCADEIFSLGLSAEPRCERTDHEGFERMVCAVEGGLVDEARFAMIWILNACRMAARQGAHIDIVVLGCRHRFF